MEEYKAHPKYYKYEVSNLGNIRNIKTHKVLKKRFDRDGYEKINLSNNESKKTTFLVHRLVAETWIDKIKDNFVVDHIDRDRKNNRVSNLRIVTSSQNNFNRISTKYCIAYCRDFNKFYVNGIYFESIDEAMIEFKESISPFFKSIN